MRLGGPEIDRARGRGTRAMTRSTHVGRQLFESRVVIVHGQAKLLEIVAATHPSSRFECRLDRWQDEPNLKANVCVQDNQLHKFENSPLF